ncbi:glycoside hydrolase family 3 N-terminal domain-containing protein, partial [Aegicerativicinus sediminis]
MLRRITLISIITLYTICSAKAQNNPLVTEDEAAQNQWVDSLYNSMTLEERIGQLFMVQVFSNKDAVHEEQIAKLIKDNHIGGLIFSLGGPYRQAKLNNKLQSMSKIPLLVGMDAEWGLSMRLDSTFAYPWNMTLGAIKDEKLIEKTGFQIGKHCKRLGVHFNFAPVVDINTNPKNPIIGNRSFGEDRDAVTEKALAFMEGMQKAGVLANAKHFPGHGDTDSDSHKTLPTIHFNAKRIDSVELHPYRELIKKGLSSVMVAHLNVPAMESRAGYPSSISKNIVTNVLLDSLKFQGLVFTDALGMKGASNFSQPGDIDLAAFEAGNDVLLMSENVPLSIEKISNAIKADKISEERLARSVKKILMAKYKVGLNNYEPVKLEGLGKDLNTLEDDLLNEELFENAITVLKNQNDILPLRDLEKKKIAYVSFGDDTGTPFFTELKKYTKVHEIKGEKLDDVLGKLSNYNTVIIGLHRSNDTPWKAYQFTDKELVWLYEIARLKDVILTVFTRPYSLNDLKTIENIEGIVLSYQNSKVAQQKTAQALFGGIASKGCTPVSIGNYFKPGDGLTTNALKVLTYGIPESVGMSSIAFEKVDSVAKYAVTNKMTPGIQLLVARKGKVIFEKNYGYHTYDNKEPVKSEDLYDVASLTKILATLPLLMELVDKGEISLNSTLSELLPEYHGSNKANITLKSMLSHYARLKPWVPFYVATLDSVSGKPSADYYRRTESDKFHIKVAENLYLRTDYPDSIQKIIRDNDLLPKLSYRYSDLPYYILKSYLERYYGRGLDKLIQEHFYHSLGANYTTYNPSEIFSNTQIVPSEEDNYYRFQRIQGYVHDMGAAMQNAVGGHAGIFSNANDVAKIMQMYLQKGFYGGKRYFKPETLELFNTCYYCSQQNRRGIGFDKPQLGDKGPTCGCVS